MVDKYHVDEVESQKHSSKKKRICKSGTFVILLGLALAGIIILGIFYIRKAKEVDDEEQYLVRERNSSDPSYVNKLKDYYNTCAHQDSYTDGLEVLKHTVMQTFGGWPLASTAWNESTFDLEQSILDASYLEVGTICRLWVGSNMNNRSEEALTVEQPLIFGLGGRDEYLGNRNSTKLLDYEERIFRVSRLFGMENETAAREEISEMVDFEKAIAEASDPWDRYYGFPLSRWKNEYSSEAIDWERFFLLATETPEIGVYDVTDDEPINRGPGPYFRPLKNILLQTSRRALANFIVWRVIDSYWPYVHDEPDTTWEATAAREDGCIKAMVEELDLKYGTGPIFINESFTAGDKLVLTEMISWLGDAFIELLHEVDWIDDDTRKIVEEKHSHLKTRIGYPEEIYNDEYMNIYYSNVTFTQDSYITNLMALRRASLVKELQRLRVPRMKNRWHFWPPLLNAFHDREVNGIEFPASNFGPPYFDRDAPMSFNFGAIGSTIGHEISHGYDSTGIYYNSDGEWKEWWNISAIEVFNNQTNCLVEQYDGFHDERLNMSIDGELTLDENIADNSGVRQSFRAYRNWVAARGKEEAPVSVLDYTHDQIFFISYAQVYCTVFRDEVLKERFQIRWSPDKYRILGPLQNSADFARTFNCPVNSYMNPENKCVLW